MAAKSGGYYRKLHLDNTDPNQTEDLEGSGIGEIDVEEFSDVFADDESKSEQLDTKMPRKRSVLKRDSLHNLSQRVGGLKKQVSFSSIPSERRRRVSNASECFAFMRSGTEFVKLRPGGRQYQRFYQLDENMGSLVWTPSTKKPDKALLPVDLVYEVRTGKNTSIFREHGSNCQEDCCFSIIIGPNYDSVDLVARTTDEAHIWVTGLRLLHRGSSISSDDEDNDMRERWLRQQFYAVDTAGTGALSEESVMSLLQKLRVNAPQFVIKQKLQEVLSTSQCNTPNHIDEDDFCQFIIDLTTRQEVYYLLVKHASNGMYLTPDDLLIFLESEQGMTWAGKEYCLDIINRCEPSEEGRKKQILGLDGLTKYFSESDCHIFNVEHSVVCEDMTKPLSHYYIAASHNTYLLDDQLKGRSSIQGYINCLRQGCRCVELECWDGPDGDPVVHRGHTMTSKIAFSDAIKAIRESAFLDSVYPVILSLEDHCSVQQQHVMAAHLVSVFGEQLYTNPVDELVGWLPSPEELKGRVIVKNKKLPTLNSLASNGLNEEGLVSEEEEEDYPTVHRDNSVSNGMDNLAYMSSQAAQVTAKEGTPSSKTNAKTGQPASDDLSGLKQKKVMKLAVELSDLVNVCKSVRFRNFQHSFERQKYWEICSVGETTARRLCQTCPDEFVSYNKRFLSRVYPAAKRVDSSNFNPVEFWNCGCQLVALNYQYPGLAMDLYRGRFLQNGQCGYVLKPSIMREEVACFSPAMNQEIPGVSPMTVQVKVISGQHFPKPRGSETKGEVLDPYVMVEVYGIPFDCKYERTRTIPHNGFNPIFDETFEFCILLPDVALLRFIVLDDDYIGDCFIGQYTIPVTCVREGYRTVPLRSNIGEATGASLFVHVSILRQSEMASPRNKKFSIGKSLKKNKEYPSLKSLGVKIIDDTFKLSVQPMREASNIRENFQISLNHFKECCGLTARSNLKQSLRILANRVRTASEARKESLKLSLESEGEFPVLKVEGEVPAVLQKALDAFDEFLGCSKSLLETFSDVYERLAHARRSALEWHTDLQKKFVKEAMKERRKEKLVANFSWNIRILSGQAESLKLARQRCQENIKQIQEIGRIPGFFEAADVESPQQRSSDGVSVGSAGEAKSPSEDSAQSCSASFA